MRGKTRVQRDVRDKTEKLTNFNHTYLSIQSDKPERPVFPLNTPVYLNVDYFRYTESRISLVNNVEEHNYHPSASVHFCFNRKKMQ